MLKKISIFLLILPAFVARAQSGQTTAEAQRVQPVAEFKTKCEVYKKALFDEGVCEKTVAEFMLFESKLSEMLFTNKQLTPPEKEELKNLRTETQIVRHFIQYQLGCGNEYFTLNELKRACELLGSTYVEMSRSNDGYSVYKTELNGLVSYMFENSNNEHRHAKFKIKRLPYGFVTGETDIQAKGIKSLYDNRTEKDVKSIEVIYITFDK